MTSDLDLRSPLTPKQQALQVAEYLLRLAYTSAIKHDFEGEFGEWCKDVGNAYTLEGCAVEIVLERAGLTHDAPEVRELYDKLKA